MTPTNPSTPDTIREALEPCPFCGGEARLFSVSMPLSADCADIQVACGQCDAIGPSVLFDQDHHGEPDITALDAEAISAWNTRQALSLPTTEGMGWLFDTDSRADATKPRIIDLCFTAFMAAKAPNDEDGGDSDWFTDTKPRIDRLIRALAPPSTNEGEIAS